MSNRFVGRQSPYEKAEREPGYQASIIAPGRVWSIRKQGKAEEAPGRSPTRLLNPDKPDEEVRA